MEEIKDAIIQRINSINDDRLLTNLRAMIDAYVMFYSIPEQDNEEG